MVEEAMNQSREVNSVILFLDQSFGVLRSSREGGTVSLAGIDLAPGTAEALAHFKQARVQTILVTIEPLPSQALQVLRQFLPAIDQVILHERDFAATVAACAKQFSLDLGLTICVAADRMIRGLAAERGSLAFSHPAIAALAIRGRSLQFVRVNGNRAHFERIAEVIPYFSEYTESGRWSLLAIMTPETVAQLVKRRFCVESLPLDISTEDPLFVQLDEIDDRAAEELSRQKVLLADGSRALLAMPPDRLNDSLPIHGQHGHFQLLVPDLKLLEPAPASSIASRQARLAVGRWPAGKVKFARLPPVSEFPDVTGNLCPSTAASFQADVHRYSGASDLGSAGPIASRHIQHPDNARAVQALVDELNAIGYCAYTHSFAHAGMTLNNVIADLPGAGLFSVDPNIPERLREIFLTHPLPDPPQPWIEAITRLVGSRWIKEQKLDQLLPLQRRLALETAFELRPWFPWWLIQCPIAGLGAEMIIVGCHLDSTAARRPGYKPATDPAPGADDDATGIAATLATARHLWNFRGQLMHTVRFCFFNAEEQGLIGSKAYAAMLKAAGAPIRAVVCADMIGHNSDAERIFEIHAGSTDAAVRDLSVPIADTIAAWAAGLGTLAPAQVYKGTIGANGADRNLYDGAINRSDHSGFHQQGYPAVVVSEDFFLNLATEPGADPNPNYHDDDDTVIDGAYGSDITCAIAYAVEELARG
jgi:hypothetical protein